MSSRRFALLLAISCTLTACGVGYEARGSLSDVAGEMRGKGFPGNRGGGRFVLNDGQGRLTCEGEAMPPTVSPTPGSCSGETGEGMVRCTDGRQIPVRWEAISCRAWKGGGVDALGNRLEFRVERR